MKQVKNTQTMEDQLIRKVKGGILGIKTGTKTPAEVAKNLNRLKEVNLGMYDELLPKYTAALKDRESDK